MYDRTEGTVRTSNSSSNDETSAPTSSQEGGVVLLGERLDSQDERPSLLEENATYNQTKGTIGACNSSSNDETSASRSSQEGDVVSLGERPFLQDGRPPLVQENGIDAEMPAIPHVEANDATVERATEAELTEAQLLEENSALKSEVDGLRKQVAALKASLQATRFKCKAMEVSHQRKVESQTKLRSMLSGRFNLDQGCQVPRFIAIWATFFGETRLFFCALRLVAIWAIFFILSAILGDFLL